MKINYRIMLSLLMVLLIAGGQACKSKQMILDQNNQKFAPLPPDTPVLFYYSQGNTKVLAKIYKSGKQITGNLPLNDRGDLILNPARKELLDPNTRRELPEKDQEPIKKAALERAYAAVRNIVPNISYLRIESSGGKDDQLDPVRYFRVSKGEMVYSGECTYYSDPYRIFVDHTINKEDEPKIADEALKRGSNVVINGWLHYYYRLDSNGNRVKRKVVDKSDTEVVYHDAYTGRTKFQITEKFHYEDICAGSRGDFYLMRVDGLLPARP